jgi:hypothetical protein
MVLYSGQGRIGISTCACKKAENLLMGDGVGSRKYFSGMVNKATFTVQILPPSREFRRKEIQSYIVGLLSAG